MTGARPVQRVSLFDLAFEQPKTSHPSLTISLIAELGMRLPKATMTSFDLVVVLDDVPGLSIKVAASLENAFEVADVVLIQNNRLVFATPDLDTLADIYAQDAVVYGSCNQHDASRLTLREGVQYARPGSLPDNDAAGRHQTAASTTVAVTLALETAAADSQDGEPDGYGGKRRLGGHGFSSRPAGRKATVKEVS